MILKSTGELIGDCGLTVQDVDGAKEVEIGYHVRRDHWVGVWRRKPPAPVATTDSPATQIAWCRSFARRTYLRAA